MKKALLKEIIKRCREEIDAHPQRMHFPHWCFIVNGSKIIASGVNNPCVPHPKWGYHGNKIEKGETFQPKTHAELHALSTSKRSVRGCVAVNVRLNRNLDIRMSAPCSTCRRLLQVFGIKKCFFTHEAGWGEVSF